MSGLNFLKVGSTLSNICNTTQLGDASKCHHAFKNFWGESCHPSSKITGEMSSPSKKNWEKFTELKEKSDLTD